MFFNDLLVLVLFYNGSYLLSIDLQRFILLISVHFYINHKLYLIESSNSTRILSSKGYDGPLYNVFPSHDYLVLCLAHAQ